MNNPFIDLVATLILLITIISGGYLYTKNKEESRNKVVEIPVSVVKTVEESKVKYDNTKFETAHKVTE